MLWVWNGAGSISVNESLSKIGRDLPLELLKLLH
jgi:hypothetical protein